MGKLKKLTEKFFKPKLEKAGGDRVVCDFGRTDGAEAFRSLS